MAAKKPAKKKAQTSFSDDEKEAMRDRVRELKAGKENNESSVLAKIAGYSESDRIFSERLHAIIKASAPVLVPRLWYGMPAYAKDGNVVCFFQAAQKFKTRYSTLGFLDKAMLDHGDMWPSGYAVKQLTPEVEARIRELVKKAVS
jgi:uncharacterized protein YdhG (YjbR/CyaY superfamily)